jgi:hypothetical protein
LVDEAGNAIDVDDLGAKDKIMHKSKSKFVNSFKAVSKRVAAIGADVTVDGVRKKVSAERGRTGFRARLSGVDLCVMCLFVRSAQRLIGSSLVTC